MNKAQLIDAVASRAGITKVDAKKALDAFISVTSETLEKGDKIALAGLGSFSVTKKPARMGRHPRTHAPMTIQARNVVKFRCGSELGAKVR